MIKLTKKDNGFETMRIGFVSPNYVLSDKATSFQKSVFALADKALIDKLSEVPDVETEEDKKTRLEKLDTVKKVSIPEDGQGVVIDKLVKAFAIGIKHFPAIAVPAGYAEIYDKAVKYEKKYKGAEEWTDERKSEFTALRSESEKFITGIIADSHYGKKVNIKISSKAFSGYLEKLYTAEVKTGKSKQSATVWTTCNIYKSFQCFMGAVNLCTGVTRAEKTKTIKVF